jgi:hypothetical protein
MGMSIAADHGRRQLISFSPLAPFGLYTGDRITIQRADDGVDMTLREVD